MVHPNLSLFTGKYMGWAHLLLAVIVVLGLGMAQAVEPKSKPVLTRPGMKAALTQAAQPFLQPSMAKMPAGTVDQTKIPPLLRTLLKLGQ